MQWFKVPPRIYFEEGSAKYLENMADISRVFIVTDETMVKLGYVDVILKHLNNRREKPKIQIFSSVTPDPSIDVILSGTEIMKNFNPDCIIALGGGSAIDAAKAIKLFFEHPDLNFDDMKLKFMDIRKRIFEFPRTDKKLKFVAIPTTSGTGSEMTCFSVVINGAVKYPLADYTMTPDVAIIDSNFVRNLPKCATADTGMDVLTHAIEAYVSTMASDFTDGLALKAIELVFKYLKRAYDFGKNDLEAREKMHNASAIAGMAFTNAFLGLNHSMAHKLGGEFGITHGRANAILLPYVMEYNASGSVSKFSSFPKYEEYIADKKYAEIAELIGEKGSNTQDSAKKLINFIKSLSEKLEIPLTIKAFGVKESEFLSKLDSLSVLAHEDQCTGTNPRYPLISEIRNIYLKAYYGDVV